MVQQFPSAVYAFGQRADDVPTARLRYEPLTPSGEPAESATEPWTDSERAEWADAEMRDAMRESGGGW